MTLKTTTRDRLRLALYREPADHELRLVYSDNLEDDGLLYQAAFHRALAALTVARIPQEAAPLYKKLFTDWPDLASQYEGLPLVLDRLHLGAFILKFPCTTRGWNGNELEGTWYEGRLWAANITAIVGLQFDPPIEMNVRVWLLTNTELGGAFTQIWYLDSEEPAHRAPHIFTPLERLLADQTPPFALSRPFEFQKTFVLHRDEDRFLCLRRPADWLR